jgi:Membrane bound O-acyl transferase family
MAHQIASTHRERVHQLWDRYDKGIESREFYAFGYPYGLIPTAIIFAYLVLPGNKRDRNYGRYLAWAATVSSCAYIITFTRARYATAAGLTGLAHGWLILWATAHLFINDPKSDYLRIKRVSSITEEVKPLEQANGSTTAHDLKPEPKSTNNTTEPNGKERVAHISTYVWQSFPDSVQERLDWAVELISSLNGMGWNWAIRSLPAPPQHVQDALAQQDLNLPIVKIWKTSKASLRRSEKELWSIVLRRLCVTYIILDALKTIITLDPFFWGYVDYPAPSYLPLSWQSSPIAVKMCRLLVAQFAIYWAVRMVLGLLPLYYMGLRENATFGVRSEAWMFPDDFGHYSSVCKHGLAGFWSTFWHQSFRYVFEAPALFWLRRKNIDLNTFQARLTRVVVSFVCSGFMHACLSYTAIGDKAPIMGSFMFFTLQPLGILIQYHWLHYFRSTALGKHCPAFIGYIANAVWVNTWLYFTGPLFIEDLSIGGWFLFEPVPISIFRGVGLGGPEEGLFTLHGRFASWRNDGWRTGIVS